MIRLILLATIFLFNAVAQAEFVGTTLVSDDNESVIESRYFDSVALEEPIFKARKSDRNIAQFDEVESFGARELQGQLAVVKEIPYSYPWVSDATMRLRVLNEIEHEESRGGDASHD